MKGSFPHKKLLSAAVALVLASCALPPTQQYVRYQAVGWNDLPDWPGDDLAASYKAWYAGCSRLKANVIWQDICAAAPKDASAETIRHFIENSLQPVRLVSPDGSGNGLITGYFEPVYSGSLTQTETARYPLHARPRDLVTVELESLYPELKGKRIRGKLVGQRLIPYPDRAGIVRHGVDAPVLAWLEDPLDVQFLQIQGSGRIKLDNGNELRLGYADQNGHPYRPIGRWLVEQGELTASEVSMQSIRSWAKANPGNIEVLLNSNPSYVFFRRLPAGNDGPPGSLGQALTAERSIAVDPSTIPLGSLVYLSTSRPDNAAPIRRLVAAQDTGGAIRGSVRADFFWGTGQTAGELAGKMKQSGNLWLLWPKHKALPQ